MPWPWLLLLLVAAERATELWLARRNTRRLLAAGATEIGAAHYPLIVALHAGWLVALVVTVDPGLLPDWPWLALFGLLQLGRLWVIATLGPYWTTRIISVAGAPLVRRGPYRLCRHPNYVVVVAEIAVLPIALHQPMIALVASVANAGLLAYRIRVEDMALATRRLAEPLPTP